MAILKRANARGFKSKLREAVWPSMGWRRTFRYYRHRMFRAGDSTRRVVAGLATGAAVCWTPFFGTHMLLTLFLCWRLRLSAVAGLIGTAFGNPTTYPFMFVLGYKVGVIVCGWFGSDGLAGLPPGFAFRHLINHPLDFLEHHSLRLMLPLSVGGCLCALVFWPLAYVALYFPVNSARAAYRAQRLRHFRKKHPEAGL